MNGFKKIFSVLLALDLIGLILAGINMLPTFKMMAEYGQIMMVVLIVMTAVMAVVLLLEILAKVLIIRSTSPTFSWSSGRKGYITAAKLLLLFNIFTVLFTLLAVGGEGATLINQGRMYLQILDSAAEIIAIFFYLHAAKSMRISH